MVGGWLKGLKPPTTNHRPPTTKKYGKDIKNRSGEPKTKIQSARLQPLQTLWPAARLPSQVRRLPHLLPPTGARRADSGGDQIQLVAHGSAGPLPASH